MRRTYTYCTRLQRGASRSSHAVSGAPVRRRWLNWVAENSLLNDKANNRSTGGMETALGVRGCSQFSRIIEASIIGDQQPSEGTVACLSLSILSQRPASPGGIRPERR